MWLTERYFFMVSSLYEPSSDAFVQTSTDSNPIVGSNVSSLQKVQENSRGELILFIFFY